MKIVWLYCKDRQTNRLEQNGESINKLISIDVKATQWGKESLQEIVLEDVSNNAYKKTKKETVLDQLDACMEKTREFQSLPHTFHRS